MNIDRNDSCSELLTRLILAACASERVGDWLNMHENRPNLEQTYYMLAEVNSNMALSLWETMGDCGIRVIRPREVSSIPSGRFSFSDYYDCFDREMVRPEPGHHVLDLVEWSANSYAGAFQKAVACASSMILNHEDDVLRILFSGMGRSNMGILGMTAFGYISMGNESFTLQNPNGMFLRQCQLDDPQYGRPLSFYDFDDPKFFYSPPEFRFKIHPNEDGAIYDGQKLDIDGVQYEFIGAQNAERCADFFLEIIGHWHRFLKRDNNLS